MQERKIHRGYWTCFLQGDESAFEAIYNDYVGVLYTYGYHIVADSDRVKEAIQDLFVHLWKSRNNLAEVTSVKYYLFRCLRRRLHQQTKRNELFRPLYPVESFDLPEESTDQVDHILTLQKLMPTLPARQQEALHLRYYEGFSVPEIAQLMNLTQQSVSNLLCRAIARLREAFNVLLHFFFLAVIFFK